MGFGRGRFPVVEHHALVYAAAERLAGRANFAWNHAARRSFERHQYYQHDADDNAGYRATCDSPARRDRSGADPTKRHAAAVAARAQAFR